MSKKKYLDMLSGVFFFLLGAVYFGAAAKLPEPLTKEPLGPAGFLCSAERLRPVAALRVYHRHLKILTAQHL